MIRGRSRRRKGMHGQGRMNARAMSSRFSQEAKGCRSKKDRGWESLHPGRKGEGSWRAREAIIHEMSVAWETL